MGIIYNSQNPHLLTSSLLTEEVFQVKGQNWPMANLPVVDFRSQPWETSYQSHCIYNFWFSSSILVFFSFLESLNITVCEQYQFCNDLDTKIQGSSENYPVWKIMKVLPFIRQPDWVAWKPSDMSAADWWYQAVVTAFLRAGNPCIMLFYYMTKIDLTSWISSLN